MTTDNIFCEFITENSQDYICKRCGTHLYFGETQNIPPVFICSYPLKETHTPTYTEKVKNFAYALVDHVKTGMKICTDQQIQKRFDICEKCEFYQDQACSKCGCPLVRNKKFISKLAWADQECPVGKWPKEI